MGAPAHAPQGDPLSSEISPAAREGDSTPPAASGGRRRLRRSYSSVTGHPTGAGGEAADPAEIAALVAAAQRGEPGAFDELVVRTWSASWSLALRLMGNEDDARDVVQDAYLRAYKGLRRFRGDARFTTWLYRIVANCAATAQTKRGKHRHELVADEATADEHPDHDPEARGMAAHERARVQRAVADLPEKLRQVLVLRDVYDLPHEAIAAQLGITETAAKVRLHRARKKLKLVLFPDEPAAG